MVPISKKDVIRAFGDTWYQGCKEKCGEELFLVKRRKKGILTWLVVNKKHDILRKVRSHIVLSKILGTDSKFEFVYDEYMKIMEKTEGKSINF